MNCQELAAHIKALQPDANVPDVARLCLLVINAVDDLALLDDPDILNETWQQTTLRLQAATDQYAAMSLELEDLARSDPNPFTQDQILILIRAIKVQSQVLELYLRQPALSV